MANLLNAFYSQSKVKQIAGLTALSSYNNFLAVTIFTLITIIVGKMTKAKKLNPPNHANATRLASNEASYTSNKLIKVNTFEMILL